MADQRPIVRSEPVTPLEIAEIDSDDLVDVRQRVISTLSGRSPAAALGQSNSAACGRRQYT